MFFVLNNKKISGAKGKKYLPWTPSIENSVVNVQARHNDKITAKNIKADNNPKIVFVFVDGTNESISDFLAV